MKISNLFNVSYKKVLAAVGLFGSMYLGATLLSAAAGSMAASIFAADILIKLTNIAIFVAGAMLGGGVFLQPMKQYDYWPMSKSALSFKPTALFNDLKKAFNAIDRALQEYVGAVLDIDKKDVNGAAVDNPTDTALVKECELVHRMANCIHGFGQTKDANSVEKELNDYRGSNIVKWATKEKTGFFQTFFYALHHELTHIPEAPASKPADNTPKP